MLLLFLVLSGLAFGDYTVKFADSLSRIAEEELGDGGRWKEIAELNGLKRPYKLEVGQTLKMPEDARTEAPVDSVGDEEAEDGVEFDFEKILNKVGSVFLLMLVPGAPLVMVIIYVLVLTGLWAVSMRLNCNVMILPEKASFGKCFMLSGIHFFLVFCYYIGQFLIVRLFFGQVLGVILIVTLVIVLLALTLYATKKTIDIGWFWAFLFLIFSQTIAGLLYVTLLLLVLAAVVSLYAVASIF